MKLHPNDARSAFIQGVCVALICDGKITDTEVKFLVDELKSEPGLIEAEILTPYKKKLTSILKRGYVSRGECAELKNMIYDTLGVPPPADPVDNEKRLDQIPFDEIDSIEFLGKVFVVTGQFKMGRQFVENFIEKSGGTLRVSCSNQIDYVIIGSIADSAWKFGNYGTKIRAGVELKKKGHNILMINEERFRILTQN